MHKGRLEAFSDGVLAIILTIMVLEIKVPHGADFAALKPLLPVALSYILSFIYIGNCARRAKFDAGPRRRARFQGLVVAAALRGGHHGQLLAALGGGRHLRGRGAHVAHPRPAHRAHADR